MISEKELAIQYMSLAVFFSIIIFPNMDVNRVSGSKRFMFKYGSRWSFILPFCFILESLLSKKISKKLTAAHYSECEYRIYGIRNVIEPSKYMYTNTMCARYGKNWSEISIFRFCFSFSRIQFIFPDGLNKVNKYRNHYIAVKVWQNPLST